MRQGVEYHRATSVQQLSKAQLACDIGPKRQGIHKIANRTLELKPRPAGSRRANQEIVQAGITMYQRVKGGEQNHK